VKPHSGAPALLIITNRHQTAGRPLEVVIERALEPLREPTWADFRGRVAVQLREKDLSGADLYRLAARLRRLTADSGALFFVNSRVDVALSVGADGVHVGWKSLLPRQVGLVTNKLQLGGSAHSVKEAQALMAAGCCFVTLGPVFATPSKDRFLSPRGVNALRDAARLGIPAVALGGLDASNAVSCLESGAAGLSCIRHVTAASFPDVATRNLLTMLRKRHKSVCSQDFCKDFSP